MTKTREVLVVSENRRNPVLPAQGGNLCIERGFPRAPAARTVTATGAGMLMDEDPAVGSSDTDGNFELTGLRAGTYHVTISDFPESIEFPVTTRDVTVGVGLSANVSFSAPGADQPTDPGDDTGAFVFISEVAMGDETEGPYKGDVTVTASVERGTARFEKLALYVDGVEVDSQEFGGPASAPGDAEDDPELAAQQVIEFKLGFNSAAYEEHGDHTDPAYMNGEHTLSVGLQIAGGQTLSSNEVTIELANDDGIHVNGVAPENSALDSDGNTWYGGPDTEFSVTVLPVLYSGRPLTAVTMMGFCGAKAATVDEAPFEFTPDCEKAGETTEGDAGTPKFAVTVEGGDATAIGSNIINDESDIFPIRLDYQGPSAPRFHPNPNGREGGWINLTVDFLGKQGKSNKDGWLTYGSDSGVGGYTPQLRFTTTTPSLVDGAIVVGPVEGVPALPPGGTKANAVCVVASAVDRLGNESGLPSAGTGCATATAYKTAVDALAAAEDAEDDDLIAEAKGDIPAGIRAGLDILPPTIAFSPASPKADASSLKEFQLQVADAGSSSTGRSGLHSMPVLSKVEARDADNDVLCGDDDDLGIDGGGEESITGECKLDDGMDFNAPLATTDGLSDAEVVGYYTFTAQSQDKAGNKSEQVVRTAVHDGEAPELGLIVGGYSRGAWSLTATLTDDLSLKQYWPEAVDVITGVGDPTAGITILPREGSVMVDEYNSPDLTQSLLTSPPLTMQVFRALQPANTSATNDDPADGTTGAETLAEIKVVGTDHGGRNGDANNTSLGSAASLARFGLGTARTLSFTAGGEPADAAAQTVQETEAKRWNDNEYDDAGSDAKILYARDQVFQTFEVEDADDDDDALELRATITGAASYVKAVAGVADNATTTDVDEGKDAVAGVEGLVNSPVSRVDFYAAVELKDVSSTNTADRVPPVPDGPAMAVADNEALVFLGSANAAGAEDFTHNGPDGAPGGGDDYAARKYTWGIDMSGAAFVEIAGDEGNYTIVAIAVNSAGVAISAITAATMVEE